MPLDPGTRLGPYQLLEPIDAHGIGEAYKATDSRLNRTVAIKVLPREWAGNSGVKELFEREARTVASLNHPHICILHDIGSEDGATFLVMEYLEGQTLAERLERGPLPPDEALRTGIALADALDKAHRKGIVHGDLKTSAIMLSKGGVKLLDFGLHRIQDAAQGAPASPSVAATGTAPPLEMTPGAIEYMAPERFEGRPADALTDIFAFGAILHEMVTGRKAFEGKSRAVLIASITTVEPEPLTKLQPKSSPLLDHVVARCLAKNPDDRWQTAHDLLVQLRWIAEGGAALPVQLVARQRKRQRLMVALLGLSTLLIAVMAAPAFLYIRGPGQPPEMEFRIPVAGLNSSNTALSPDGQTIALVADPGDGAALYARPVNSFAFRKFSGTEGAALPFWSPDNRWIAFTLGGRLKKVDAQGGPPQDIGPAADFAGGAWSTENTILFGSSQGLYRVSAEGGTPELLTTIDKSESGHFWPSFLPDARHYLYTAWSAEPGNRAIFAGTLGEKERTKLLAAESNAAYAAPGYLVFHREATVFARPFNTAKLAFTGEQIHLADRVAFDPGNGRGIFDVSQTGALLYFEGANAPAGRARLITLGIGWVDRTGASLGQAVELVDGGSGDFDLSPDGKRIAWTRQPGGVGGADIWVTEWESQRATPLTLDPADDIDPVWAPSGDRIAFTTYRKGNADIYVKNANGVGPETPLLESSANESIEDWSKDGKTLAFRSGQNEFEDIYLQALTPEGKPEGKPVPVVQGKFRKDEPQFSYDGKWLAYTSNEGTGTFQVYVVSLPDLQQRQQVSTNGGGQPRWMEGNELYYREEPSQIMVSAMKPGPKLEFSAPRELFRARTNRVGLQQPSSAIRHMIDVTRDGRRFLLHDTLFQAAGQPGQRSAAPRVQPTITAGVQSLGPRGGATRGALLATISGLTVKLHWTGAAGKVTP